MAEPLRNQFGPEIARQIAAMISAVHADFPAHAFLAEALEGYGELDLLRRGWRIAEAMGRHLPQDYGEAVSILLASIRTQPDRAGMASFIYLPHTLFVAGRGLEDFEVSMSAQRELTRRFTAEFSMRPFLEKHPEATLARLKIWAGDPDPRVRRLVSECTRPRLPWAARLRALADPRPALRLLELLKDDPELLVRRSVANHLNDIGKDHPGLLAQTARRWMAGASEERRRLIRHALRSAVRRAEPAALAVLGLGGKARAAVRNARIAPRRALAGGKVSIAFEVASTGSRRQKVLVDFRVFFIKANGLPKAKVFKLRTIDLAPGETARCGKTISLAEMSTRRHYSGRHRVEAILNGRPLPIGWFDLAGGIPPKKRPGSLA